MLNPLHNSHTGLRVLIYYDLNRLRRQFRYMLHREFPDENSISNGTAVNLHGSFYNI